MRVLTNVRKPANHSKVVAVLIVEVKADPLVLPKAILRQTPRHLAMTALDGYGFGSPTPICTSSCIPFVTEIGSQCIVHIRYIV